MRFLKSSFALLLAGRLFFFLSLKLFYGRYKISLTNKLDTLPLTLTISLTRYAKMCNSLIFGHPH